MSFSPLWDRLLPIGRGADGGYHRLAWTDADLACREWFRAAAAERDLDVEEDGNGNLWAWWAGAPGPRPGTQRSPEPGAIVTGSHLDSVPGGGAYDGPLGVVSAFLAVDALRAAGVTPSRPLAVVDWSDEEGGRWGVACTGSRMLTGDLPAERALALRDRDGVTLAEAMRRGGHDPVRCGPDPDRLAAVGTVVELHVEQGRRLVDLGAPVGVATAVWPHGRWRIDLAGRGDHAGTTRLVDRSDPVLTLAAGVLAARQAALDHGAVATVGRLAVHPGAVNAIASRATAWLDARAAEASTARAVVSSVTAAVEQSADAHGVSVEVTEESWTGGATFPAGLRGRLASVVEDRLGSVAELPTGAGHDAAVLATHVPAAMLFVRNPTGVSHDPAESATDDDCSAGVAALAAVLEELLTA